MKKVFMLIFLVLLGLLSTPSSIISTNAQVSYFTDSDHEEDYKKYNEYEDDDENEGPFEEIGEVAGWGSIAMAVGAGLLFPMRKWFFKMLSTTIGKVQSAKIFKFVRKIHTPIGLLSIGIGAAHGVFMYISEGQLEIRDWIGISGIGFMFIAMIFGFLMMKKKQKTVWTLHISSLTLAAAFIAVHVLLA